MHIRAVGIAVCTILAGCAVSARFTGGVPDSKYVESIGAGQYSPASGSLGQARDVDLHRAEGAGLVHAPALAAYLNEVLAKLVAQSPVRGVPAKAYVSATDQFCAVTSPDSNIFVCLGAIQSLGSEEALAALLAHELAHAIRGHAGTDTVARVQAHGVLWTSVAVAGQAQFARQGFAAPRGGADLTSSAATQALLLKVSQRVVLPSWTRTQEREADLLGVDLMARAGYDPNAFVTMLDVQLEAEARDASDESLAAAMKETFKGVGTTEPIPAMSAVFTKIGTVIVDRLGREHPDVEERRATVRQYVARHYPPGSVVASNKSGWGKALSDRQTKSILAGYKIAKEARDQLASGRVAEAASSAQAGINSETRDHSFTTSILASVRSTQGKPLQAEQVARPALAGREPSWLAHQVTGLAQISSGKSNDGLGTFEHGYRRLNEPFQAIPYLLLAYQETGRTADAERLERTCAVRYPHLKIAGLCSADVARKSDKSPEVATNKNDRRADRQNDRAERQENRAPGGWNGQRWWPR